MDTNLTIRARGIAKCFGDVVALDGIHLDVTQGQVHGLAGSNGAGKTTATCNKGGGMAAAQGPGNDWRCTVSWHLPDVDPVATATYQLAVSTDGRFVTDGDGPKEVNGFFLVQTPQGKAPNPLWQFDSNVDLLTSRTPG